MVKIAKIVWKLAENPKLEIPKKCGKNWLNYRKCSENPKSEILPKDEFLVKKLKILEDYVKIVN